ncbi:hypothetical protein CLOHYLEM_07084 [[Clostridium] hylemonae DSM 15053]|uniref:Uncharacterized protein n=1 Tax=[Clostridium] hylemonae DSM 15053 TaxID=553973 RepID=C0C4R8_9FIRM|nr:hypothetical protein CLOHYLEM_07084 [[Clostridium] hylemonae DSM 15053]
MILNDWGWTARGWVYMAAAGRSGRWEAVTVGRAGSRQPSLFGMKS